MPRRAHWLVALLVLAALPLAACAKTGTDEEDTSSPSKVEEIGATGAYRVVLVAEAAARIGVQTAPVRQVDGDASTPPRTTVAYSAIVYDPDGVTSVYTNPEPLVFVRKPITVDRIQGDLVILTDGPPVGTAVVTVGAEELLGAETGIGEFE